MKNNMIGSHKFLKTYNGITAFCNIELKSVPNDTWILEWIDITSHLRLLYNSAVERGVEIAKEAYIKLGGTPQKITIKSLSYTVSDTKPDAVTCSTAIALWNAWCLPKSFVNIFFEANEWHVKFNR